MSGAIKNWQVKNNVVFTLDEPNSGIAFSRGSLPTSGLTMSHNLAWNIPGTPTEVEKANPGLALSGKKPTAYYLAKEKSSAVVDQGTDVGFPFQGNAPDIGAYEWSDAPQPAPAPSNTEVITAIDAEPVTQTDGFSIYPNPTIYTLTITRQSQSFSAELVNALGVAVGPRQSSTGNAIQLDLSSCPSGVYFLKIYHAGGITSQRIVKQ